MTYAITHLSWNVLLAVIAVGLALAIPPIARRHHERDDHLLAPLLALVVVLWFVFLPNTCYLLTEPRHLFQPLDYGDLWARTHGDRDATMPFVVRLVIAAVYAAVGAVTFAAAIRPVRAVCEARGFRTRRWLPIFFFIMAVGVYLGLFLRFNSWDALTDPGRVVIAAVRVATRRAFVVMLGGLGLWGTYEVIEVVLSSALVRSSRLTRAFGATHGARPGLSPDAPSSSRRAPSAGWWSSRHVRGSPRP